MLLQYDVYEKELRAGKEPQLDAQPAQQYVAV